MGKGEDFERELCKDLSLWWTQDLDEPREDVFWRTSGSGARATTRMKKGKLTANSYGDMMAIDPIGQPLIDLCFLEFKRGYTDEIGVLDFVDKRGKIKLLEWWRKAEREIEKTGQKYIVLIFKRDRHERCVMITEDFFFAIEDWKGEAPNNRLWIRRGWLFWIVMRYDDFFEWVDPAFFELSR